MPLAAPPAARLARHGAPAARPAGRVRVGLPAGVPCHMDAPRRLPRIPFAPAPAPPPVPAAAGPAAPCCSSAKGPLRVVRTGHPRHPPPAQNPKTKRESKTRNAAKCAGAQRRAPPDPPRPAGARACGMPPCRASVRPRAARRYAPRIRAHGINRARCGRCTWAAGGRTAKKGRRSPAEAKVPRDGRGRKGRDGDQKGRSGELGHARRPHRPRRQGPRRRRREDAGGGAASRGPAHKGLHTPHQGRVQEGAFHVQRRCAAASRDGRRPRGEGRGAAQAGQAQKGACGVQQGRSARS